LTSTTLSARANGGCATFYYTAQPPQLAQTDAKREPDRAKHRGSVVQKFPWPHYSVRSIKEASQLLLDVAVTPPLLRRGARTTTPLFFTLFWKPHPA